MSRTEAGAAVWAVVPAAGYGRRFNTDQPKQYTALAGRTVIEHTLATLLAEPRVSGVVVALAPDDTHWAGLAVAEDSRVVTVTGGSQRHTSVLQGLQAVPADDNPWVAVHDAARPCLDSGDLARLLDGLADAQCGRILASPAADTLKLVDSSGRVERTLEREGVWQAQTPQVFRRAQLLAALQACETDGFAPTDEAAAVERAGGQVTMVAASAPNPKITTRMDLMLAEGLLARRGKT